MADKTISRLEQFRQLFYDKLNVDDILDDLERSGAIASYEKVDILHEKTSNVKIDFMLACLTNYGDEGYQAFIEALKTCGDKYARIVSMVEKDDDQAITQRKLPPIPWQATAESLTDFPWYVGNMERDQASKLIEMVGEVGTYLVRLGSKKNENCPFVLTVMAQGRTWHVQIGKRANQKYAMGKEKPSEQTFMSIPDMIYYFHSNDIEIKDTNDIIVAVKLTKYPVQRDLSNFIS